MISKIALVVLCAALSGAVLLPRHAHAAVYGSVLNQMSDLQIIVTDPTTGFPNASAMGLLTADSTTRGDLTFVSNIFSKGTPTSPITDVEGFTNFFNPFAFGTFIPSTITTVDGTTPIINPLIRGAVVSGFNTDGNPFRPSTATQPTVTPTMTGVLEFAANPGDIVYLTVQNRLDFTIDVALNPITIQFAFSSLISLVAEDNVFSSAGNSIRILDINNNSALIFNFSPSQINTGIVANAGEVSTLSFVGSFLSTAVALPVGDYEIIVDPEASTGTIPEPSSLFLLGSGLLILAFAVAGTPGADVSPKNDGGPN